MVYPQGWTHSYVWISLSRAQLFAEFLIVGLQSLLDRGMTDRPRSPRPGNGMRFEFHTSTGGLGGAGTRSADDVPTMSE